MVFNSTGECELDERKFIKALIPCRNRVTSRIKTEGDQYMDVSLIRFSVSHV